MNQRTRPLLAVLIDADNIRAADAEAVLDEVKLMGEPALRRVYGDWSQDSLNKWSEHIHRLGLVAHQTTANTKGKNASDIGLVIDAMDILHSQRFDGFVLVSSDSDFTALANRLRESGLMVVGIGENKTPEALRNVCNRFILIENIRGEEDHEQRNGVTPSKQNLGLNHAFQRISNAIRNIDQDGDWYNLSQVKNAITATHSDFDQRSYGYSKFSDLVKALSGKFETKLEGKTMFLRSTTQ